MSVPVNLTLTQDQHEHLRSFLYPGDGKEAVAILLCGRRAGDRRHRLVAQEIHGIPYDRCPVRTAVNITWHPDDIVPMLERAAEKGLSVVKVHSHPTGYAEFSRTDDEGDACLLPMVRGWVEADVPHGSAVMLPNGDMFGRVVADATGDFEPLASISVAGDELLFWYPDSGRGTVPDFAAPHAQAFDQGTIERLQKLSIAVIGASGTGSPVIEQLIRLGVGELIIADDDKIEERNINRIINSTMDDATNNRLKVDVIGDAIDRTGLNTKVIRLPLNLWNPDVVRAVAQCDVVFGCMDTVDGRYLLNALSTYYVIAYFDIGVRLDTVRTGAQHGRIREVCGTIHYLKPGRSSLMSRDLFSMKDVAAAGLRRNDPEAFKRQLQDGYIRGVLGHRPAVINVNMLAASLAVNEFLARLHPFREEPNTEFASVTFSLASMEIITDPDEGICEILGAKVGLGDTKPLLGMIELAERRSA
jgi:molybdopterin/thiamine biosynthesis adenylyltransferase/proteasome lid subunit RPN8/RPN11